MNEGEDGHRKRIRKRSHRQKDGDSSAEQTSDYDDSERSMLDETRESRNPNFECWYINNVTFERFFDPHSSLCTTLNPLCRMPQCKRLTS